MTRKSAKSRRRPVRRAPPKRAAATPTRDFVAAGAKALGLTVDRRWLPEIESQLAVTLRHGASVAEFRLPDDGEPAPVFEA